MPDATIEARELLDLVNRAIVRSCNCGTKFSKPVKHEPWCRTVALEKAASFISRTAQPQEVTTEMVERASRVMWPYWDTMCSKDRSSAKAIMRPCLTAALQVNPPSPSQGGR